MADVNLTVALAGAGQLRAQIGGVEKMLVSAGVKADLLARAIEGTIRKMASAFTGTVKSSLQLNSNLEQTAMTFEVFTKSAAKAGQIMQMLRKEAADSPFSDEQVFGAGRALISMAQGSSEELLKLIKLAERLSVLNPAQGLEGAAFAIKEASSGDFVSLIERFNVSRTLVNKLKKEGKDGTAVINELLNSLNVTDAAVAKMGKTFEGRKSTIASFFSEIKRRLGEGVFTELKKFMESIIGFVNIHGPKVLNVATRIGKVIGDIFSTNVKAIVDMLGKLDGGRIAGWMDSALKWVSGLKFAVQEAFLTIKKIVLEVKGLIDSVMLSMRNVQLVDEAFSMPKQGKRTPQQQARFNEIMGEIRTNKATMTGNPAAIAGIDAEMKTLRARAAGTAAQVGTPFSDLARGVQGDTAAGLMAASQQQQQTALAQAAVDTAAMNKQNAETERQLKLNMQEAARLSRGNKVKIQLTSPDRMHPAAVSQ